MDSKMAVTHRRAAVRWNKTLMLCCHSYKFIMRGKVICVPVALPLQRPASYTWPKIHLC